MAHNAIVHNLSYNIDDQLETRMINVYWLELQLYKLKAANVQSLQNTIPEVNPEEQEKVNGN